MLFSFSNLKSPKEEGSLKGTGSFAIIELLMLMLIMMMMMMVMTMMMMIMVVVVVEVLIGSLSNYDDDHNNDFKKNNRFHDQNKSSAPA